MYTEKTDNTVHSGWLFYDGDCTMCRMFVRTAGPFLRRVGFTATPLQQCWVARRLNLSKEQLLAEMRILTREGRVLSGADALVHLLSHFDCLWPLHALIAHPLARPSLRSVYRWIAQHRYCGRGACRAAIEPFKFSQT